MKTSHAAALCLAMFLAGYNIGKNSVPKPEPHTCSFEEVAKQRFDKMKKDAQSKVTDKVIDRFNPLN